MCDLAAAPTPGVPQLVVGIDLGSATVSCCAYTLTKVLVLKPFDIPNDLSGFRLLHEKLTAHLPEPAQILFGFEATGRYGDALYQFLTTQGYQVQLLHPQQTAQFARQRGLRAKTDHLDATTIARVLLSGEARPVYVPDEQIRTYRELVRVHTNLRDEAARYKQEIRDLVRALFPEFTQVFANPTAPTALQLLAVYPSPAALIAAGVEQITAQLRAVAPRRYGRATSEHLVELAQTTVAGEQTAAGRALSLRILCDQLLHTQANVAELETALAQLLNRDEGAAGLRSVPEFGPKTQAVLRAELGDVHRFQRGDQVVAYAGLDLRVRQSGQWRGQAKVSKRGSGLLRRSLYMAAVASLRRKDSAFKEYYAVRAARGLKGPKALMAVMRKMLLVADPLLKSGAT